jgi:hypothetical protein
MQNIGPKALLTRTEEHGGKTKNLKDPCHSAGVFFLINVFPFLLGY